MFLECFSCVSRLKIYSARSFMNLRNVYKFTQKTLARRSSFDRFSASYYLCFHIPIMIIFLIYINL